jgi:hypothetical protein
VRVESFAVTIGMGVAAELAKAHSGWSSGQAKGHIAPDGKLAGT